MKPTVNLKNLNIDLSDLIRKKSSEEQHLIFTCIECKAYYFLNFQLSYIKLKLNHYIDQ